METQTCNYYSRDPCDLSSKQVVVIGLLVRVSTFVGRVALKGLVYIVSQNKIHKIKKQSMKVKMLHAFLSHYVW
jgi:hypothetical protein